MPFFQLLSKISSGSQCGGSHHWVTVYRILNWWTSNIRSLNDSRWLRMTWDKINGSKWLRMTQNSYGNSRYEWLNMTLDESSLHLQVFSEVRPILKSWYTVTRWHLREIPPYCGPLEVCEVKNYLTRICTIVVPFKSGHQLK